jgi:hypothetical protein
VLKSRSINRRVFSAAEAKQFLDTTDVVAMMVCD